MLLQGGGTSTGFNFFAALRVFVRHINFPRTCFRAVAQIPFEQLVAHREKLESLNEKVGVDGGEVIEDGGEVNEKSGGKTHAESALASSCLTLAFSLVIITIEHRA